MPTWRRAPVRRVKIDRFKGNKAKKKIWGWCAKDRKKNKWDVLMFSDVVDVSFLATRITWMERSQQWNSLGGSGPKHFSKHSTIFQPAWVDWRLPATLKANTVVFSMWSLPGCWSVGSIKAGGPPGSTLSSDGACTKKFRKPSPGPQASPIATVSSSRFGKKKRRLNWGMLKLHGMNVVWSGKIHKKKRTPQGMTWDDCPLFWWFYTIPKEFLKKWV